MNPVRECRRCGETHTRKHYWCLSCQKTRAMDLDKRAYRPRRDVSTPPAPPPGFDVRDLHIGRPLL